MNKKHCETVYDAEISTFTVRIFGDVTEVDVIKCFEDYERIVEEKFGHKSYNVIINVDEAAHALMSVLRIVRESLQNQKYRQFISNIVAVNENPAKVVMRNSLSSSNILPFFNTETEAKQYIAGKMHAPE
jgi:hypothetical protein